MQLRTPRQTRIYRARQSSCSNEVSSPQSVGAEAACGGVKKEDLQKEAGE